MFWLKPKFIIPLALVLGVVASYGVYSYLQQQKEKMESLRDDNRDVVVSTVNLLVGATLKAEELQLRKWPANLVPAGSFQEIKLAEGRVLNTDVIAGEAILESKLAPAGSTGGVASLIPPGMRAVTVAVNVVSGVGGFILPKTRVDVLATVAPSGKKEETSTKVILQNVLVLAVDQTFKKDDDDPVTVQSVTLLVSPEEAEKLALAGNEGKLQLMLRNNADPELHNTDGIQLNKLLGRAAEAVPPPRPSTRERARPPVKVVEVNPFPKKADEETSSRKVVEVIRANVRSEVTFKEEKGSNGEAGAVKEKSPTP